MSDPVTTCPCGADVMPNPNRSRAREARRKYCSKSCAGRYGGGRPVKAPEVLGTCPCGVDIVRNPRRSRVSEAGRKYCSRQCAADARRGRPGKYYPRTAKVPAPVPAPVVVEPRPVREPWRPAGWAPVREGVGA